MQGRTLDTTGFDVASEIPNQTIRLEVDRTRHVELHRWLVVGLALMAAALFNGWQRSSIVSRGYRLEAVQRERAREEAIQRHHLLEIETLSAPARIERMAADDLRLVAPGPDNAVVIERVVPPSPPPALVVAVRR